MIDNVRKRAVSNTTIITELDFRSENSFRTCSVATNLLTPLEINPIRCATMLCHFGQTGSCYVAIRFTLRVGTTTSSATGDYVALPERFSQNEEPAGRKEERTWEKPSLVPSSGFIRFGM